MLPGGRFVFGSAVRTTCASICLLANSFAASCAELPGFTFLSIGYRPPQERVFLPCCAARQSDAVIIRVQYRGMGSSPMFTHRPWAGRNCASMCSLANWLTAARVVGRKRESMCPLANSFAASRAEFPDFTFLSFGYCPPQEVLRTAYRNSACGGYKLCEYLPSDRCAFSSRAGIKDFAVFSIECG